MGHELLIPTSSQATWVADSVLGTRAGEKSLCSGSSESAGEDQQVPAQDARRVGVTGIDSNEFSRQATEGWFKVTQGLNLD